MTTSPLPTFTLGPTHAPDQPGRQKRFLLKPLSGDDYILEVDHTTISNYLECEKKGEYNMIEARVSHRTPALIFGAAIHRALETYYRGELDLSKIIASGAEELLSMPNAITEWRNYELYAKFITKYVEKYVREDPFTIYKHNDMPLIECAFAEPLTTIKLNSNIRYTPSKVIDLPEGVPTRYFEPDIEPLYIANLHIVWTGVIDLVIEANSSLTIMDHKTTSIEGPHFWKAFELSQQFAGYVWAAQRIIQKEVKGAWANVIYTREPAKTVATQKLHESKLLTRQFFPYRPDQISEWEKNMIVHMENFAHNLVTGNFSMHTNACTNKFGVCPYHDVCVMRPEQRATMLATDQYTDNTWSPLN